MTISERLYILLQYVLPHHLLSRLARAVTRSERPWLKRRLINWAINKFNIDLSQAEQEDPEHYPSFNAFFTRSMKPELRPIDPDKHSLVSPCDGHISQLGPIDQDLIMQAKGQHYSLKRLLADDQDMVERFTDGQFINIYLSPRDYHRLHMPVDGKLLYSVYVPGRLFSVAPLTTAHIPALCARNDRLICYFDTPIGVVAQILVGAVMVAGIESVWHGLYAKRGNISRFEADPNAPVQLARGDEMGRFNMGSTVILLFEKNRCQFDADKTAESALLMGQSIASTSQINQ